MTTVDFDHEWMTWGRSGGVLSSQGQSAQLDIGGDELPEASRGRGCNRGRSRPGNLFEAGH